MSKIFGQYIRQQRVLRGYTSGRAFARVVGMSPTLLSDIELGHKPYLSEEKINRIADLLGVNRDELLALNGKVSTDVLNIILKRPKELAALIRQCNAEVLSSTVIDWPVTAPSSVLEFYPWPSIAQENHTAVVGESGSGKSILTRHLIQSFFSDAEVRVYDSDAAPHEWGGFSVIGRKGDYEAIAASMKQDLDELRFRTELYGDGLDVGLETVRVIEEYPTTAAELAEHGHVDIGLVWLRKLLRRGRKYRMKVFAVAQEFEVNAWRIAGEGGLRRSFTVLYLGATVYRALSNIKDKVYRENLRCYFESVQYPCLVDVKGRYYPAIIPILPADSVPESLLRDLQSALV